MYPAGDDEGAVSDEALRRELRQPTDVGVWMQRAACVGVEPSVFFVGRGGRIDEALSYCDRCEVRMCCLAYAVRRRIVPGVWGGMPYRSRRPLEDLCSGKDADS